VSGRRDPREPGARGAGALGTRSAPTLRDRSWFDDRGSGTVLTLGLVAVVLVLFTAIALLGRAQSARGAAQAAADLGALAAAQQLLDGPGAGSGPASGAGGEACAIAREVAAANAAHLTGCVLLPEGVVRVTTERRGGLGNARASARAGPAPPGAG